MTFKNLYQSPQEPRFAQYDLSTTATPLSSSSILDTTEVPEFLTVRNAADAANACYLGGPAVANTPANAGVELSAGESYTFKKESPAAIYIVGTVDAANIAFITAEYE